MMMIFDGTAHWSNCCAIRGTHIQGSGELHKYKSRVNHQSSAAELNEIIDFFRQFCVTLLTMISIF